MKTWVLAAACLLAAPAHAQTPPPGACAAPFVAPQGSLDLARELHRMLYDGKELTVTRHYRVTFERIPRGFRVDGTLASTDVDAPERLSALATLEKARQDTAMFPILLDANGMVQSSQEAAAPMSSQMHSIADQLIAGSGLKALNHGQAESFVEELFSTRGPVISQWPDWVFRPGSEGSFVEQRLPLPGGGFGTVTIALKPSVMSPCGALSRLERAVDTQVGDQHRSTREVWTLTPLP